MVILKLKSKLKSVDLFSFVQKLLFQHKRFSQYYYELGELLRFLQNHFNIFKYQTHLHYK